MTHEEYIAKQKKDREEKEESPEPNSKESKKKNLSLIKPIVNLEDFKEVLIGKVQFAKASFLLSVKEEYFSKLFIKINSLKNNQSELYTKHFSFIKKVLRQISLDGIAVVFEDSGINYFSSDIIYYDLPDPYNPTDSFWQVQYFKGYGTTQSWENKILGLTNKFVVVSTERYSRNLILGDISILHPADLYWLNVLMEQAKTMYIESWKSKGVLDIGYSDSTDNAISEIYDAFEYGFSTTRVELNPSGGSAWDITKDINSPFKNGRINNIEFNSAKEMDEIYKLLKKGCSDLFKAKGLFTTENQKDGVYNEHSSETEGKDQERNEALIEVVRIYNKNISSILSFLEGREINFEFILEIEEIQKSKEVINGEQ